jgi:hypothetical protein
MQDRRNRFVKFNSAASALIVTVLLASGGASAKVRKINGFDDQAHVVAHISFTGLSAVDMAMQKKANDKYFLYVQHSKDEGISIIDISKPTQPKAVGVIPWPNPATSNRMDLSGELALISESAALPARGGISDDDLVLWDLSNPASPRQVQKFSGVVRWLQDERNFVYVLNSEGLWVVSGPADRQAKQVESTNDYTN